MLERIGSTGRWRLVAVLLLIAVGGLIYVQRPSDDEPTREGSRIIEADVDASSRTLQAYAISYRVETHTDAGVTSSTDDVVVDRPFRSRVTSRSQDARTQTISALGRISVRGNAFHQPPGAADADRRPDAVLAEAVEHGYAEERETRRVADRDCLVYRIGDGQDTESLARLEDADTYTDVCVDEAGLILEEATFDGSDLVHRRVAQRIDESPKVPGGIFDLRVPDGDAQVIGSVQTLEDDSRLPGEEFWQPSRDLKGFTFEGRYAVVPPGQPGFTDLSSRGSVITFLSEVWTDGPDVVVIDQGATKGSRPFDDDPNARTIKAGDLGDGEMRYSLRESEVRSLTSEVRFVRVRGTLPPSRLLDIARTLEAIEGGPLRVKDG